MVITRELMLQAAGLVPADLAHAVKRTRQALNARTKEGEPDHRVRLEAADRIFDLHDVRKRRADEPSDGRPVNVAIILTDARAPLQAHGVRLHLSSGDGENGHG